MVLIQKKITFPSTKRGLRRRLMRVAMMRTKIAHDIEDPAENTLVFQGDNFFRLAKFELTHAENGKEADLKRAGHWAMTAGRLYETALENMNVPR